jgi:hypothetical protein
MLDNLMQSIEDWIRDLFIGMVNSNLQTMFNDVNQKTSEIAQQVGQTPQGWNSSIFNMIQGLSNNVIVPIAGIIIAYSYVVKDNYILINNDLRRKITKINLAKALEIQNVTCAKIGNAGIWGPSYIYGIITDSRIGY